MRDGLRVYDAQGYPELSVCLMYASDYPHSECQFPNSVDNVDAGRASSWARSASCSGTMRAGSMNRPRPRFCRRVCWRG